jgi:hypothetical protein
MISQAKFKIAVRQTELGEKIMDKAVMKTALLGIAVGGLLSATAVEAKKPQDEVLTEQSPTALIVMKADSWPPTYPMVSAYKLLVSGYDATEEKLSKGSTIFEAQPKKFFNGYLMARIKPGRWAFQSYSQQDLWALCFNASTLQFDVKAGEVVFLGDFDALAHREQLTLETAKSGKGVISGYGFADFFDLTNPPLFKPVDTAQVDAVKVALQQYAPKVTAPVRAAQFSPARFGTGSTLFAERKCGGYFGTSAKNQDPKKQKAAEKAKSGS